MFRDESETRQLCLVIDFILLYFKMVEKVRNFGRHIVFFFLTGVHCAVFPKVLLQRFKQTGQDWAVATH